jgi:hypothetical protein
MSKSEPVVGYKLTRADCAGWLFAGITPEEVAKTVAYELDADQSLPPSFRGAIILTPLVTTQAEIDSLPEFEGW